LTMAKNLLKAKVAKDKLFNYALKGNMLAEITKVTDRDTRGTVVISVKSEGEWVYQFNQFVKQGFAKHIAHMSKQSALRYLSSQPGVKSVNIDDTVLPDAAHITFQFMLIPGVYTFSSNSTMISQPLVSPSAGIPSIKTSPTRGCLTVAHKHELCYTDANKDRCSSQE